MQVCEVDAAVDQHARAAGEGAVVTVADVALEIEAVVGEDGRELEREQAGEAEPEGEPRELPGRLRGSGRTHRIGGPCHGMELQPEAPEPGGKSSAHALALCQRAVAQGEAFAARIVDPLGAPAGAGRLDGTEDGAAHRRHAAEAQRGAAECVQPRRAIDVAVDEGRRIHGRQQMGALADQQLVPALAVVAVLEGEARHQHAIEEALQAGRHGAPPGGEDEDQVLGPGDEVHGLGDGGLALLVARRGDEDVGLEAAVGQGQTAQLDSGGLGARRIGIGQRLAEAAAPRMAEDEQNLETHHETPRQDRSRIIAAIKGPENDAPPHVPVRTSPQTLIAGSAPLIGANFVQRARQALGARHSVALMGCVIDKKVVVFRQPGARDDGAGCGRDRPFTARGLRPIVRHDQQLPRIRP